MIKCRETKSEKINPFFFSHNSRIFSHLTPLCPAVLFSPLPFLSNFQPFHQAISEFCSSFLLQNLPLSTDFFGIFWCSNPLVLLYFALYNMSNSKIRGGCIILGNCVQGRLNETEGLRQKIKKMWGNSINNVTTVAQIDTINLGNKEKIVWS